MAYPENPFGDRRAKGADSWSAEPQVAFGDAAPRQWRGGLEEAGGEAFGELLL